VIVTCPDCDTSFQLDESRIPQKGIRVRCSRCKHAFHLLHPSVSRSEAVDAVAAEAVGGGETSSPSVTQDLEGPLPSAVPDSQAAARKEINNEDDAEWEFNQDIPSSTQENGGAEDGALFGSVDRDAPSGLDLAADDASMPDLASPEPDVQSEPEPAPTLEAANEPAPPVAPAPEPEPEPQVVEQTPAAEATPEPPTLEVDDQAALEAEPELDTGEGDAPSAFGSVDDFSSLMDDDSLDSIAAPEADHTADELRAQAAEQESTYTAEEQGEDLGDPAGWDFFDGEAPPAPAPPAGGVPLGRIGLRAASATDELARDWDHTPVADPTEKGRAAQMLESAGRIFGWTAVIVGLGLGIVSGLWTTAESYVAGERVTPVGSLEAVDMRAQWMDTARAGRLLLVSGGLRNPTRAAARMSGPLEIALLDRLGDPLARPAVSAGVVLSERQLRELPAEVLTRVRTQAAIELQTATIPAGGLLPFQVLVFDAPHAGLRFEARLAASGALSLPEPMEPDAQAGLESDIDSAESADASDLEADPLLDDMGEVGVATETAVATEQTVATGTNVATEEAVAPAEAGERRDAGAPANGAAPAAPGWDDPYEQDSGMGLQDL